MAGKIIRLKQLVDYIGLSRSTIYDRLDENSRRFDPDFPKPQSLGGSSTGWLLTEIDAWCEKRRLEPRAPAVAPTAPKPKKARSEPAGLVQSVQAPISRQLGGNLAESILFGSQINNTLLHFLRMESWTPAMGALLISGVVPPTDATEIPESGDGLDGQPVLPGSGRLLDAKSALRDWHYSEEDSGEAHGRSEVTPFDFLLWCQEDRRDSPWLRLMVDIAGAQEKGSLNLTAGHVALMMTSTTYSPPNYLASSTPRVPPIASAPQAQGTRPALTRADVIANARDLRGALAADIGSAVQKAEDPLSGKSIFQALLSMVKARECYAFTGYNHDGSLAWKDPESGEHGRFKLKDMASRMRTLRADRPIENDQIDDPATQIARHWYQK